MPPIAGSQQAVHSRRLESSSRRPFISESDLLAASGQFLVATHTDYRFDVDG